MRSCAVVALTTTCLLGACGGSSAPPPPSGIDQHDPVSPPIAAFLDRTLPAASSGTLVAARDGALIHCAGFGMSDRDARVPASCDTAYDVMSMTKQFTAAGILKLEMQGLLELDDPLGRHLPGVPPDKRRITLHHLLTHTSGLTEGLGDDHEPLSREDMISRAFASELRSSPGAEYRYSNLGYSLLAAVVEQASGTGYEEYLAEHLFSPAGMSRTGYVRPTWERDQVAVEYDSHGEPQGLPFDHPWASDGPYWNLRGNGGLVSTARDMFRWHLALEDDLVLDRAAKEKLFAPHVREEPGGASFYGYGWVVQDTRFGRVAAHDGGNGWSYGELVRIPDERVMIFWVTNQQRDAAAGYDLSRLAPTLTLGVAERLLDD